MITKYMLNIITYSNKYKKVKLTLPTLVSTTFFAGFFFFFFFLDAASDVASVISESSYSKNK